MSRRLCRLKTAVLPQAPGPTPQHPLLRSYSTSCVATTSFSPQLQNDIEDAFEETTVEAMVDIGEEEEIETADAMVTVNEEEDARNYPPKGPPEWLEFEVVRKESHDFGLGSRWL
ncbi:hypothetical protein PHLCEN_2v11865 [Hermanssonia centrifuga]|uniref:Uncharacterized protein n=1 Tax=Hermanssonia centrifuga TaxID=98765 RepID=A0A2R6NIW2_9APHY|nr:hypothetical protein PHLCEN_2v11865 [Hermanssonia centrifuga]